MEVIYQSSQLEGGCRGEAGDEGEGDDRTHNGSDLGMRSSGMREEGGILEAEGGVSEPAVEPECRVAAVGNGGRGVEPKGGKAIDNALPHGGVKVVRIP